jgi:hypothetical protein
MYVTVMTRPDLAFAVLTLSQYLKSPHSTHLRAVTCVFQYLLGTKHLKLTLGGTQNVECRIVWLCSKPWSYPNTVISPGSLAYCLVKDNKNSIVHHTDSIVHKINV